VKRSTVGGIRLSVETLARISKLNNGAGRWLAGLTLGRVGAVRLVGSSRRASSSYQSRVEGIARMISYSPGRTRGVDSEPMTKLGRPWNIRPVPIRECPHCGIRQYAQVSYVAHVDCVHCGTLLVVAHPPPSRPSAVTFRERATQRMSSGAMSGATRRGRP
jgi:hypothetical protein